VKVETGERVDSACVAADATVKSIRISQWQISVKPDYIPAKHGVLHNPANNVHVQCDQAIFHWLTIEVLRNGLVAFAILEAAVCLFEDGKETSEDILREDAFRLLGGMVRQQSTEEEVASVTTDHACDRAIVKVRIVRDTGIKATDSLFGQHIHGNDAALVGAIVEVLKQCHIHSGRVAGDIEVIARKGCIGLEPIVSTLKTARFACE
jgi:hypothetical protein